MQKILFGLALTLLGLSWTTPSYGHNDFSYQHYYCHCDAVSLSRRSIYLVDRLQGYADYKEYGRYLLPIKKVAGFALAAAEANGNISATVHQRLLELQKQICIVHA